MMVFVTSDKVENGMVMGNGVPAAKSVDTVLSTVMMDDAPRETIEVIVAITTRSARSLHTLIYKNCSEGYDRESLRSEQDTSKRIPMKHYQS